MYGCLFSRQSILPSFPHTFRHTFRIYRYFLTRKNPYLLWPYAHYCCSHCGCYTDVCRNAWRKKGVYIVRLHSHCYWLAIFRTTNSGPVLAKERLQSIEILGKSYIFLEHPVLIYKRCLYLHGAFIQVEERSRGIKMMEVYEVRKSMHRSHVLSYIVLKGLHLNFTDFDHKL